MPTQEQYRSRRNVCCWLGVISAFIGNIMMASGNTFGFILWSSGIILNLVGGYAWAKYKGRSGWYTLWAILAPIGFIGLAVLEDRYVGARSGAGEGPGWRGD